MRYAPVILFVYNRPDETEETINALKKNLLSQKSDLFIYSDAAKNDFQRENVNQVRRYINSVSGFKSVTITESDMNMGLANSVINGVTAVINKYGRAIVLEDDLVTSPNFLSFMNQALDMYENDRQIISVSGCTFRINIPSDYSSDVYFTKRMCSYGWATWSDRWKTIDWNINDYNSFKFNIKKNLAFMKGGEDLPRMLSGYTRGKIDSWAVRFCYHQYKTSTYTVYPIVSKVKNIGFNAMATNTTRQKEGDTIDFEESTEVSFLFPKDVFIDKRVNKSFLKKYTTISRILNYLKKS